MSHVLKEIRKTHNCYHFSSIVQSLARTVRCHDIVKKKYAGLVKPVTLRAYCIASIRRHLGCLVSLCDGEFPTTIADLDRKGKNSLPRFERCFEMFDSLDLIPSSLRSLPVFTVFAFLAWGLLVKTSTVPAQAKLCRVRTFLENSLKELAPSEYRSAHEAWDSTASSKDSKISIVFLTNAVVLPRRFTTAFV